MGRRAFALLEHNGAPTHANIDTEEAEVITFDSSFYIYGGQQHYEALEGLCNDCAKKCNKTRASLDGVLMVIFQSPLHVTCVRQVSLLLLQFSLVHRGSTCFHILIVLVESIIQYY